jgi:hypothetical protein
MRARQGPSIQVGAEVEAIFVKSSACRTIHVDGAFGGLTTSSGLNVHASLYSEYPTSPESIVYEITSIEGAQGSLREKGRKGESLAITREIEADLIMSVETARSLGHWLLGKVEEAEKRQDNSEPSQTGSTGEQE